MPGWSDSPNGSLRYGMRTKPLALALAAMLALSTGGVAVAAASSDSPAGAQLPDDYTVDVNDPFDELSATEVDEAIATAYANERVQRHVDTSDQVHFRVVAGTEQVEVQVAPGPDATEQLVAEISPDGTVTEVFEPEVYSEDAESVSLVGPFDLTEGTFVTVDAEKVDEPAAEQSGGEYDEKLDAEESMTLGVEILDQTFGDDHLLFDVTTAA
jgi:hypothetical protein